MIQAVARRNGGAYEIAEAGKRDVSQECGTTRAPSDVLMRAIVFEGRCLCGLLTQFAVLRWSSYRRRGHGRRSKSTSAGEGVVGWNGSRLRKDPV